MTSSNSTQSATVANAALIDRLVRISAEISRYLSISIFIFGTIGNVLNILILSNRSLRKIPCVFLFLISSIASLIAVDLGLITRILSSWATDPTYNISWVCKARTYLVFSSRATLFWLLVLATIDRWLSSSRKVHFRRLSHLRNARRGTLLVILLCLLVYAQVLHCYEANLVGTPFKCYTKSPSCQLSADMTFALFSTICPLLLMLMFGLMTISNIRQSHHQVIPAIAMTPLCSTEPPRPTKRTDRHLLCMVFVQVIVLTTLTLPQAVQRLYANFVSSYSSQLLATIDMFVYNIVLLLTYLACAMPFYIYTLAGGSMFQKVLFGLFGKVYRSVRHRRR